MDSFLNLLEDTDVDCLSQARADNIFDPADSRFCCLKGDRPEEIKKEGLMYWVSSYVNALMLYLYFKAKYPDCKTCILFDDLSEDESQYVILTDHKNSN